MYGLYLVSWKESVTKLRYMDATKIVYDAILGQGYVSCVIQIVRIYNP